jgi:16S rRNA (guanine527-N7)-methyltransferase
MGIFEEGLTLLKITATADQIEKVETYINELMMWNEKFNLISAAGYDEIIIRHILDSLSCLKTIDSLPGSSIADVGSGAGLPGILLAVFLEHKKVYLIERSGKKAGFLRNAVAVLGLRDRIEVVERDLREVDMKFDTVVLRAFRQFADFLPMLRRITAEGGRIAACKGRIEMIRKELQAAGIDESGVEITRLEVPFLDEERNLVMLL